MPRVSFAVKDQSSSLGFEEGYGRVVEASVKIHQYTKRDGTELDPFVCIQFGLLRLDAELDPIAGEDEIIYEQFRIGGDFSKCRPGNMDGADDDAPDDLGEDQDEDGNWPEGNCLYADEGYKPWPKSATSALMKSLELCNVKASINAQGYMPNYVGMECKWKSEPSGNKDDQGRDYMHLVAEDVPTKPKAGGKAKPAAKKKTSKKASSKKKDTDEDGDDDALTTARSEMAEYANAHRGEEVPRKKLQTAVMMSLTKQKVNVKFQKAVVDIIKDVEQLAAMGADFNFAVDTDDQTITFAEEES